MKGKGDIIFGKDWVERIYVLVWGKNESKRKLLVFFCFVFFGDSIIVFFAYFIFMEEGFRELL